MELQGEDGSKGTQIAQKLEISYERTFEYDLFSS